MGLLCLVRVHHFTFSVVTPWGYKSRRLLLCTPMSSHTIYRSLLTSFPAATKRERERGVTGFQGVLLLLPFLAMVTLGHLESLANQGFMVAMELTACRVLEDPAFPTPVKGDVVTFVAFY
jgi:hypothetical protein